ncbi:MAG: serine hydrolase domain-containing protein [Thermodesulfobacteriota bacterium]
MDYYVMKAHPARNTKDMRRGPGNRREAPSRRLAARLCAAVLVLAAAAAPLAGCNDDKTLTETINRALRESSIPGVIVGVWREGEPPYVRAFGVQDTATGEPMSTDLYMRIGSNTKAFVVTSILILADQDQLDLGDPIGLYVEGVPNGDKITLRQLAQMRSGLFSYSDVTIPDIWKEPFREWTPQELLEISFSHPPLFPPGSEFDYSNTNTVLLGLVVEKVSGQTLASFIGENILEPLGLTRTVFPSGAEIPSPHSQGYFKLPDGEFVDATDWNPSWGWAAGNMISTLDDMGVWARALATGKLISPAMKKEQHRFLPAPEEGDGALYGLALENQNGWLGHNGNILSYLVYPYYLPSERITLVVMANTGDILGSWRMMQEITRIISPDHPWPGLPLPPNE